MDTLARSGSVGAAALVLYAAVLLVLSVRYARATGGFSLALFLALALRSISEVPLLLFGYGTELFDAPAAARHAGLRRRQPRSRSAPGTVAIDLQGCLMNFSVVIPLYNKAALHRVRGAVGAGPDPSGPSKSSWWTTARPTAAPTGWRSFAHDERLRIVRQAQCRGLGRAQPRHRDGRGDWVVVPGCRRLAAPRSSWRTWPRRTAPVPQADMLATGFVPVNEADGGALEPWPLPEAFCEVEPIEDLRARWMQGNPVLHQQRGRADAAAAADAAVLRGGRVVRRRPRSLVPPRRRDADRAGPCAAGRVPGRGGRIAHRRPAAARAARPTWCGCANARWTAACRRSTGARHCGSSPSRRSRSRAN